MDNKETTVVPKLKNPKAEKKGTANSEVKKELDLPPTLEFLDNMPTTNKKALSDLIRLAKMSNKMVGAHVSMAGMLL